MFWVVSADLTTTRSINNYVSSVVGSVAEWLRHPSSNLETRVQFPERRALRAFMTLNVVTATMINKKYKNTYKIRYNSLYIGIGTSKVKLLNQSRSKGVPKEKCKAKPGGKNGWAPPNGNSYNIFDLFMYSLQGNRLGSWKVRRLNQVLQYSENCLLY